MIIDVDTHWELATSAKNGPLAPWSNHLPGYGDLLAHAIAGDLLAALPDADRPSARTLLPALFVTHEIAVPDERAALLAVRTSPELDAEFAKIELTLARDVPLRPRTLQIAASYRCPDAAPSDSPATPSGCAGLPPNRSSLVTEFSLPRPQPPTTSHRPSSDDFYDRRAAFNTYNEGNPDVLLYRGLYPHSLREPDNEELAAACAGKVSCEDNWGVQVTKVR